MSDYQEAVVLRGHEVLYNLHKWIKPLGGHIAGGFARWCVSPPNPDDPLLIPFGDIDIFSSDNTSFYGLYKYLRSFAKPNRESEFSVTWDSGKLSKGLDINLGALFNTGWEVYRDIQIVKPIRDGHNSSIGTLEGILDTFDFSVCQAGIVNPQRAIVGPHFFEDEKNLHLRLLREQPPKMMLLRMAKYVSMGYRIDSYTAFENLLKLKVLEPHVRAAVATLCGRLRTEPDLFYESLQELYDTFVQEGQLAERANDSDWHDEWGEGMRL